ncbi:MAG: zinc-binding dehydrogenase [Candidatus Tectomicrobia bacterium]|uniref:Zinc-binding dehydrogenase n=1 Tax=Tectimicrobiota bacterium TaxID=2528274 RepID=A0A937VZK2_UNCTE|nr:zinc-binding dehydrogenase [Candidatus Tectomicrobia bacterium]
MRQMCILQHGPPEVLTLQGAPDPPVTSGTVGIAVRAIGVNFADVLARQGLYPDCPKPPVVVGYEVAGVVEAVGEGVTDIAPGQPVLALTRFGGYAERVVVPTAQVFALPPTMPFPVAASLPVNYLTAHLMLYTCGHLHSGERVLIHGAAGGVGLAAVQLARLRQAEIYGTASAAKHAILHEHGVQHTIDYYHHDIPTVIHGLTGGRGVDIVLDPLGGRSFAQSYAVLAPLGRLIVFGVSRMSSGFRRNPFVALWHLLRTPRFHPLRLMQENKAVIGIHLGRLWGQTALMRDTMQAILHLYTQGQIAPVIAKTFPLAAAPAAHRYLQERRNVGKVVLTIDP